MSFNWSEFYRLAQQLQVSTADEAALRTAISRAYYAAYHLADGRRKTNKVPLPSIPNAGLHVRLWILFQRHSHAGCKKIGFDGDRLRKHRTNADYDPVINNLQREVHLAMREAQSLIALIGALPANLP